MSYIMSRPLKSASIYIWLSVDCVYMLWSSVDCVYMVWSSVDCVYMVWSSVDCVYMVWSSVDSLYTSHFTPEVISCGCPVHILKITVCEKWSTVCYSQYVSMVMCKISINYDGQKWWQPVEGVWSWAISWQLLHVCVCVCVCVCEVENKMG